MAKLTLLGSGAALSDAHRENMYLVVQTATSTILVDVAGSPVQRLLRAGISLDSINHIILTHHHPDHLYGLPILLMDLWLAGRKQVLHLFGLEETIHAARALMNAFDWGDWHNHGFFPTEFHKIAIAENGVSPILDTPEIKISVTRTKHFVPTIALRFESHPKGKTIVYSSDTEVCDNIVEISRGADVLLHEATSVDEPMQGHSSARQAGQQAKRAGVKELVLVHLPPNGSATKLRAAAAKEFSGKVVVAKDYTTVKF